MLVPESTEGAGVDAWTGSAFVSLMAEVVVGGTEESCSDGVVEASFDDTTGDGADPTEPPTAGVSVATEVEATPASVVVAVDVASVTSVDDADEAEIGSVVVAPVEVETVGTGAAF